MKFIYLIVSVIALVGCGSESPKQIAINNPASLRAMGVSQELDLVLAQATEDGAPILNPSKTCPNEISSNLRGVSVECGAIRVPEDHRAIDKDVLAVGYLKIPKVYDPSKPLLVLEQGGPGGSSMMLAAMYVMTKRDLIKNFNILAIEQRGTPWTYPLAICEDVVDIEIQSYEQSIDAMTAGAAIYAAQENCLKRASAQMDVSKISSYQIAKDIVFAAEALGFNTFNYYGVSYGTVVGQYLIKYSKSHLDNVVLDSPAVVGKLWMNDAIVNMDSLAATKFESYRKKYLSSMTTDEAIDFVKSSAMNFEKNPLKVSVNYGPKKFNIVVDQNFFMSVLFQMLVIYPDDSIAKMLLDAAQTAKNNPDQAKLIFGFLLPQIQLVGQSITSIMYQSIICREFSFAGLDTEAAVKNWVFMPKLLGESVKDEYAAGMNVCTLNIAKSDEDVILSAPIQTDKSILVVGGELDHVTNPKYVSEVAVDMPNAHMSVFEDASHGVFVSQPCISESISNYLLSSNGAYTNECL